MGDREREGGVRERKERRWGGRKGRREMRMEGGRERWGERESKREIGMKGGRERERDGGGWE